MNKIFIDAKDKNVATYVLYADATYLYTDSAKTTKATAEEVADAFVKGMLIEVSGVKYVPVSIKHTDAASSAKAYETVSYIKPNGTTATSADIATARSTN